MEHEEYSDKSIICPYCGDERDIDIEVDYDESGYEEECANCGKTFFVDAHVSWTWTTKQNCKLNNEEHDWSCDPKETGNRCVGEVREYGVYMQCLKCGETGYVKENHEENKEA